MDPRTDGAWNHFCPGKCRRGRGEGRSLLGCPVLSVVRTTGAGHPQAGWRLDPRYLRIGALFCPVLHPRRADHATKAELTRLRARGSQLRFCEGLASARPFPLQRRPCTLLERSASHNSWANLGFAVTNRRSLGFARDDNSYFEMTIHTKETDEKGKDPEDSALHVRQERAALDVPRQVMYAAGSCQHRRATGGERQPHEVLAGDDERGFGVGRDVDYAAASADRCCNVEVVVHIDGDSLRASEAAIEDADLAVWIDLVDRVEAGGCRPGDVEISVAAKRKMVGRDAGLEHGKDEDLAIAPDLEDCSAAVADVEKAVAVEGQPGRDAHTFGVRGHGAVLRHAIHRAVEARGDIQAARAVEGQSGRVHHLVYEGLDRVVGVDAVDGDGNLLAARAGKSGVDVALGVDGGIRHRMQVLGDRRGDAHLSRIAARAVGGDDDLAGSSAVRHAGYDELVGAYDDRALDFAEADAGPAQFARAQAAAHDADLASGHGAHGVNGLDVRLAIHVFCARLAFRHRTTQSSGELGSATTAATRLSRKRPRPDHPLRCRCLPAIFPERESAAVSGCRILEKV